MSLLKARWRLILGGVMILAAAGLLAVGVWGLVEDDDHGPGFVDAGPPSTATPVPTVAPVVINPQPSSAATPELSNSPVVYVSIERLGVEASVMELGLDADRVPLVPNNSNTPVGYHAADMVAWYNFSTKPGHGGNVVLSGHVNWLGRQGVFGRIKDLEVGDIIRVFLQDGNAFTYQVTENMDIPWDDPEAVQLMLPTDDEVVTLITCGGTWVPDRSSTIGGNYTHRTIVRAAPAPGL